MKVKKMPVFAMILVMILMCLTGCSKSESWAYNFDETKEILRLNSDGTAVYQAKVFVDGIQKTEERKYTSYKKDDSYLTLSGSDGELKMRCETTDNGLVLYEKSTYVYTPREGYERGDGIVGVWTNTGTDRLFYEFSEKGNFMEDGVFVGDYFLDGEPGSIRLDYYDDLPDTILYYTIEGDEMVVEYPWDLVPTK